MPPEALDRIVEVDVRIAPIQQLPKLIAGVNTTADENHPSLEASGRHLVFQRTDAADGTKRARYPSHL